MLTLGRAIEEDLSAVKELVADEVANSHGLLASRPFEAIDYRPVILMLLTARGGDFESARLRIAGTSLALLGLGAREHYLRRNKELGNLMLVAGDYWYARAMTLASSLGDVRINERLAEIICDMAEAEERLREAEDQEIDSLLSLLEKKGSFYKNAFHLGILLSGLQEVELGGILARLGKEVALLSQLQRLREEDKKRVLKFCQSKVSKHLEKLREHEYKSKLAQVIDEINM